MSKRKVCKKCGCGEFVRPSVKCQHCGSATWMCKLTGPESSSKYRYLLTCFDCGHIGKRGTTKQEAIELFLSEPVIPISEEFSDDDFN